MRLIEILLSLSDLGNRNKKEIFFWQKEKSPKVLCKYLLFEEKLDFLFGHVTA